MGMQFPNSDQVMLEVEITTVRKVALGVVALELRPCSGYELKPFEAGAHIDVVLPVRDANGQNMVRQYSLCNDPQEHHRYVIGVGRDVQSRGGSEWLNEHAKLGDILHISIPRNNFSLNESADHTVFVAGGIGVTPLLAMARRLSAIGRPWTFYYCARNSERAAFLTELSQLPGMVIPVFDGLPEGKPIDLYEVMANAPLSAHFYCCGPSSLMEAFQCAAADRPSSHVHVEWFKPKSFEPQTLQGDRSFEVKLARSGLSLNVPTNKSLLDVLIDAGIAVQHSCCDGVCGTCETSVLEGVPEHRDSVLFGDDAKSTDRMMVCVSRSITPHLTLDL